MTTIGAEHVISDWRGGGNADRGGGHGCRGDSPVLVGRARVRRETFHELDDQETTFLLYFDEWVRYMHVEHGTTRGYSGLDSVCGKSKSNFMAGEDDSEIVYEKMTRHRAGIFNACVESLEMHERAAIYRAQGLASVWRFPRVDMAAALLAGMARLRVLVAKRC